MTAATLVTFALLAADGGIVAERYDDRFDKKRIHVLASSKKMLAADFTADSSRVVLIEAGNLASVAPDGTKYLTLLAGSVGTFRLTPDSKYAVVPGLSGGGLTRIAVTGGSRVELAKDLPMGGASNLVVSPDSASAAYTESNGALVIADVLEGLAVKLDVPAPKDLGRCHLGSGWVKAFTPDSKRLLYQHGCQDYAVVDRDGAITTMPSDADTIVGDVVLGFPKLDGYDAVPLSGEPPWHLDTPRLWGLSTPYSAAGGKAVAFLAADSAVYYLPFDTKRAVRISPEGVGASSFISVTPDGSSVLWTGGSNYRCEAHRWDVAKGRDTLLVAREKTPQCFVHAAGNARAVFNAYVDDNKRMDVWVVDFETLTVRRIAPTFPEVGNVYVSPDGRWVLVDTRRGLTSIAL